MPDYQSVRWPNDRPPPQPPPGPTCSLQTLLLMAAIVLAALRCFGSAVLCLWAVIVVAWSFHFAYRHRAAPWFAAVAEQLQKRTSFPIESWSDPRRAEVAREVCGIVNEEARWPNANFLPDDPLPILLFHPHADGCEGLVVFVEIERRFGRRVHFEKGMTLGMLVDSCYASEPAATADRAASSPR